MSEIGSISSSYSSMSPMNSQKAPEASEVKAAAKRDGESRESVDNGMKAPTPTVNMTGQKLGQIINEAA